MEIINIQEKVRELSDNKEFMEKVHKTTSIEEYQQLLAEYGVDTTVEELMSGFEQVYSLCDENGELTAEVLDTVAGGRVNALTYLGFGGQVGCTLAMMAAASGPVGWGLYGAACVCGLIALASL